MRIDLQFKQHKTGISAGLRGKNYDLVYPGNIWQSYPTKDVLFDNLAHLLTVTMPLVAGAEEINYNTSEPLFKEEFKQVVLRDIPGAIDDYKTSAKKAIERFKKIKYKFKDKNIKKPNYDFDSEERALVSLSCGKDSLLTLGVCHEIGLNPICVYINDTVTPTENKTKLQTIQKIGKQLKLDINLVTNNIEKINDFEYWGKGETCVCYSHMMTGFCFISLPFVHHFKTRHIVVGNEQNMNFSFINKEGLKAYPSYDQTNEWTKEQDNMIKKMTNGKTGVTSVVRPLTNIAEIKVLFHRYPELAKHQFSCDCLNASRERRWCHTCSKCARLSLLMKANNINPKFVGFRNLMEKKHKKLYVLFNGKEIDHYEKSREARDQQLLSFYLAHKNKATGYLMDLFKEMFLKEAQEREDELLNKFYKLYDADIPREIKSDVLSVYKEELS